MTQTKAEGGQQNLQVLEDRLRSVPADSRKLLVHILELAYKSSREGRQQDTAYLPELHESCGLDVEGMYEALQPLQRAGLIELENQYPFEDIRLIATGDSGQKLLPGIFSVCEQKKVPLRDVLVDLRFDLVQ